MFGIRGTAGEHSLPVAVELPMQILLVVISASAWQMPRRSIVSRAAAKRQSAAAVPVAQEVPRTLVSASAVAPEVAAPRALVSAETIQGLERRALVAWQRWSPVATQWAFFAALTAATSGGLWAACGKGVAQIYAGAVASGTTWSLVMNHALPGGGHRVATSMGGSPSRRGCLLYTSPSPRDQRGSRMPSSA